MASGDYEWNAKATYYKVVPQARTGQHEIVSNLTSPPTDKTGQDAFAHQFGLIHGDVVNFGDHRDVESYIAIYDALSTKYSLVKNLDDSGSGYLTLPAEVFIHANDSVFKYGDFVKGLASVNMHISRTDKMLKEKFQVDIPEEYLFDVYYMWGTMAEFFVSKEGFNKWQEFDFASTTWDDIVAFFDGASGEQSSFSTKATVEGEEYTAYIEKYGSEDDKYAWLKATPNLPKTWKVEKGQSRKGPDFYHWEWHFSGPAADEAASKKAVEEFFEGFTFSYI